MVEWTISSWTDRRSRTTSGVSAAIVGHHGQGAGIDPLAHAPDVQVGDSRLAGVGTRFHDFPDLIDHRVIHLTVEQHLAGIDDQPLGPDRHQHGADDAHDRVQP